VIDPSPGTQHVGKQSLANADALLPLLVHFQCRFSSPSQAGLQNEEQKRHGYVDSVVLKEENKGGVDHLTVRGMQGIDVSARLPSLHQEKWISAVDRVYLHSIM
jgi:hypothetical protein